MNKYLKTLVQYINNQPKTVADSAKRKERPKSDIPEYSASTKLVARLLASDFPAENPLPQTRNFLRYTLGLTPKNHTTNSKRAEKRKTECQPFSKTKRGVFPIPLPPKTPHLILPNRPTTTTITIQQNPNIGNV